MSVRCVLALLVAAALGCSSNDPAPATPDGSTAMMGGACTGAAFDPCTTNDQCMSMDCHFYGTSNFTVCTQTCTPGDNSTCPVDATGNHALCNTKGLCKPAAPNNCTR
jgi:hypothetical protein